MSLIGVGLIKSPLNLDEIVPS